MANLNEYENLISVHTLINPPIKKCFNLLKIERSKIPLAQKRIKLKMKNKRIQSYVIKSINVFLQVLETKKNTTY